MAEAIYFVKEDLKESEEYLSGIKILTIKNLKTHMHWKFHAFIAKLL